MPISVAAQDNADTGGFLVGFGLSEQLLNDDDGTVARTDVTLAVSSQTRSQRLLFDIGTGLDAGLSRSARSNIENPRFGLDYALENRSTTLDFNLNYRRQDIDTQVFSDTAGDTTLVIEEGKRADFNSSVSLTLGREARFGATASLAYGETNFFETTAANVIDNQSTSGALRLRFDLSRDVSAFVGFTARDLDRDGGVDVRSKSLTASVEVQLNDAVQTTLDVGLTRVENRDDITGVTTLQDGLSFGISAVAERPNGNLSGLLDSDILENGRRTTLQINRQLTLPRSAISGGIGVSDSSNTGSRLDPLYRLAYTLTLPRSEASATFNQNFSTSTTGIETLDSRMNLSLNQTLTNKANLSAAFGFQDSNQRGAGAIDSEQMDLSLSYVYALDSDWELFGGVSHTRRHLDGQSRTTEDRFFFGVRASFEWRP